MLTRLVALTVLTSAAACTTPEALQEFMQLPLPADSARYSVGSYWQDGTPIVVGQVKGERGESIGVTSLEQVWGQDTGVNLGGALDKWIGTALNLSGTHRSEIRAHSLCHRYLIDVYDIKTEHYVVWETIEADEFEIAKGSEIAAKLDAELASQDAATRLAESVQGGTRGERVGLTFVQSQDGGYCLRADRPLVFAVRLVRLSYVSLTEHSRLNLADHKVGQSQSMGLGYRVTMLEPPDPIERRCLLQVENPLLPRWHGAQHEFAGNEPWENREREVIGWAPEGRRPPDFIWDTMRLEWTRDLRECVLVIDRQAIYIERIGSTGD